MNDLHPDAALLRAYAVGDLPDEQAQQLEQHLADCPDCEQTIDNLSAGDETLISGLRQPRPNDPVLAEPQLKSALGRIAAMVQGPGQAAAESAEEVEGRLAAYPTREDLGQLGVYRLLSRLGEGGMGTVYKALHTKLKRTVALKVLPAERLRDPHAVARFEREMEAVGRLEHPNILRAMDAGEADGKHFLVMEYVPGCDLAELSRRLGPLPVADACELIRQAADGLEFAHQRGPVHRDIKPANIMVESRGSRVESGKTTAQSTSQPSTLNSQLLVKILDLGLARLSSLHDDGGELAGHHVTGTGQIMGTIDYMAPEQAADSHTVDIRADIYSLGATLYKLLTGHSPYHGQSHRTTLQKLNALANQPIPPIQSRRSDVPDELAALVHRLLDKDANQRPATPAEVAAALAPFTTTASLADLANRAHVDPSAPTADPATTGTHASVKSASVDTLPHDHQSGVPDAVPASPSKLSPTIDLQRPPEQPSASVGQAFQPDEGGQPGKADVRRRVFLTAAAAGGILLLAALVFFVRTKDGVIRVEINDPAIEVAIQGTDITLKQADQGRDVKLSPGEKTLLVSRDGLQFETDKLILKRGETVTVHVELLAGEIQVRGGDTVIGREPLPNDRSEIHENSDPDRSLTTSATESTTSIAEAERRTAEWVLSIGGMVQVSDQGVGIRRADALPATPFRLTYVDLQYNNQVSDAGLAHFKDCRNLTTLDLNQTQVSDAGLAYFKDCRNLSVLYLHTTQVSDAGLAHFKDCQSLTYLNLNHTRVSDASLELIVGQPQLDTLHLLDTRISRYGYDQLKAAFPDSHIEWSEPNRTLAEQVLSSGGTVDIVPPGDEARTLKPGDPLPRPFFQVRRVVLRDVKQSPAELLAVMALLTIAEFDRLEAVDFSGTPIGAAGLEKLANQSALTDLSLADAGLTDADITRLPVLPKLSRLVLDGNLIRGIGLAGLEDQPALTDLSLACQTISDFATKDLARLKQLKRLTLTGAGLTDAGLPPLHGLTNLESLDLRQTKVSAEGIKTLAAALPNCRIEWDGGVIEPK